MDRKEIFRQSEREGQKINDLKSITSLTQDNGMDAWAFSEFYILNT